MTTHGAFALGCFVAGDAEPFLGVVSDATVAPVTALASDQFGPEPSLQGLLKDWPSSFSTLSRAVASGWEKARRTPIEALRTLAPLPAPGQVFCAGANYGRHVVEMVVAHGAGAQTEGMDADQRRRFAEAFVADQAEKTSPYIFMKPTTALAGPFEPLILPAFSDQIDWELELGAVIGRSTYQVRREHALSQVAGYMVVNDITARDKVRRADPGALGPDWIAAKGAPGFLPVGPYFVPAAFVPDPQNLAMRLALNGETMQDDCTSDMTFSIARQIEYISTYARMEPGDLLCTGSPAGNGVARGLFLKDGDVIEAEIAGLGRQVVRCRRAPEHRAAS